MVNKTNNDAQNDGQSERNDQLEIVGRGLRRSGRTNKEKTAARTENKKHKMEWSS